MVTVDPYKKYLNLEGVRVSHKRKDDTIHITATDPDVQAAGFHLALSRGTQTEETLRDLLLEHGVIRTPEKASAAAVPVENTALTALVTDMVTRHERARADKDWRTADDIREQLHRAGVALDERESETVWHLMEPAAETDGEKPAPAFRKRPHTGTILTITSAVGGVGKTTLAMLVASALAKGSAAAGNQLRVAVVDLDIRDGQIGFLVGKTGPSALNAYLRADKSILALEESLLTEPNLGVKLLLAPKRARSAEILTPDFYSDIIHTLADTYDFVILDAPNRHLDPLREMAYNISDAILFVTSLGIGSVYGMTRWFDEMKQLFTAGTSNVAKEDIAVVVNRSERNVGVDLQLLKKASQDAKIIAAVPEERAVVRHGNLGTLSNLLDVNTTSNDYAKSIYGLAQKLTKQKLSTGEVAW